MTAARRILLAAVLATSVAGGLVAQSYGTGEQGIVIGAAAFTGQTYTGYLSDDGYLYQPNFLSTFSAPLNLPDGAAITQLCLYSTNFKGGATIVVQLEAVKLGDGAAGAVYPVAGATVTANYANGYDSVCSAPFSYTFHDTADIDGDQAPDHIVHRLSASLTPLDSSLGLGAVRVLWHRQISPAPGSPSFADVPASNAFFQHVEALAASGITSGCGGGNYCPDASLTRAQMAVFLAKALGLHWPY